MTHICRGRCEKLEGMDKKPTALSISQPKGVLKISMTPMLQ